MQDASHTEAERNLTQKYTNLKETDEKELRFKND